MHARDQRNPQLRLILNDLRLPAIKERWPTIAEQSDKEAWPAARFSAAPVSIQSHPNTISP
jgi:hypothetical protein